MPVFPHYSETEKRDSGGQMRSSLSNEDIAARRRRRRRREKEVTGVSGHLGEERLQIDFKLQFQKVFQTQAPAMVTSSTYNALISESDAGSAVAMETSNAAAVMGCKYIRTPSLFPAARHHYASLLSRALIPEVDLPVTSGIGRPTAVCREALVARVGVGGRGGVDPASESRAPCVFCSMIVVLFSG